MDKAKALHNADSYAWMALEYYWSTRCGMKFQDSIESIESDNTNDDLDVPLVLAPALPVLASKGIKVAANAGCVATEALFEEVVKMVAEQGLADKISVAWVEGDVVTSTIKSSDPASLRSVCTGQSLAEWPFEPLFAQCYLGGWAIAKAFEAGADIVLCGRCADASPIVAAAAWWHGWQREDFDRLSRALIAGHLIECSTYVTGGNFTGFKQMDWTTIQDLGYPIAEIGSDGEVIVTKARGSGGSWCGEL